MDGIGAEAREHAGLQGQGSHEEMDQRVLHNLTTTLYFV